MCSAFCGNCSDSFFLGGGGFNAPNRETTGIVACACVCMRVSNISTIQIDFMSKHLVEVQVYSCLWLSCAISHQVSC